MAEQEIKLPTSPAVEHLWHELYEYAIGPNANKERRDGVRWRIKNLLLAQHQASTAKGPTP